MIKYTILGYDWLTILHICCWIYVLALGLIVWGYIT